MQHSTNHNLKLMEATDNVRRQDFVDNFNALDNGISPFYVATESATNTYKVTTGANKTILQNGYSIRVAIPKNSTGAVSITVDSVTVPVKKPNGNAVTNFKQNGVYSLTYYNSVFILASGGVDDVNFTSDKLLTGYSANDSNGEKVNGTMPNNGAKTASLNCGGSYTIPAGYHNGSGKVTANSLSSQTSANATAKDIIKGKTAWVNGSKITGTATIQSLGGKQYATGTTQADWGSTHGNISLKLDLSSVLNFKPLVLYGKYENKLFVGIDGIGSLCYSDQSGDYKYIGANFDATNKTIIVAKSYVSASTPLPSRYENITWYAIG